MADGGYARDLLLSGLIAGSGRQDLLTDPFVIFLFPPAAISAFSQKRGPFEQKKTARLIGRDSMREIIELSSLAGEINPGYVS